MHQVHATREATARPHSPVQQVRAVARQHAHVLHAPTTNTAHLPYIEMPWHFHAMLSSRSRSLRVVSALTRAKEIDEGELEVWAVVWGASSEAEACCVVRSTAAANAATTGWALAKDRSALARTTTTRRVDRAAFRYAVALERLAKRACISTSGAVQGLFRRAGSEGEGEYSLW